MRDEKGRRQKTNYKQRSYSGQPRRPSHYFLIASIFCFPLPDSLLIPLCKDKRIWRKKALKSFELSVTFPPSPSSPHIFPLNYNQLKCLDTCWSTSQQYDDPSDSLLSDNKTHIISISQSIDTD